MSESVLPRRAEGNDSRRFLLCAALAVAVHAALLSVIPITLGSLPPDSSRVPIDLEFEAGPILEPPRASQDITSPEAAPAAVPAPDLAGAAVTPPAGAVISRGSEAAPSEGDFVIPSPRVQGEPSPAAPLGFSFREAGGRTGASEGLPQAASAAAGSSTVLVEPQIDTGVGSLQRGGSGVAVAGQGGKAAGSPLDLKKLDQALADSRSGPAGSGDGTGTGAGTGTRGTGQPGSGAGTSEGSGDGTGGYRVVWNEPDAGTGRQVLSSPAPKVPRWVSTQGLTLSVVASFTLTPEGIVSGAKVEQSSGYTDVDAAVVDAIRRWRFTAAKTTRTIRGTIPYLIKAR